MASTSTIWGLGYGGEYISSHVRFYGYNTCDNVFGTFLVHVLDEFRIFSSTFSGKVPEPGDHVRSKCQEETS